MNNLGHHFQHIEKDFDNAKKYYLMGIDKGDSDCMYNLGHYYKTIEKNYDNAKKYYLMGIEKGDSDCMNGLGRYYETIENDYDNAKKYYLMGIEKGNSDCMNNLGHHFQHIEKDFDNAKKYYLMGIDKGDSSCMNNLGHYYETIENDYNNAKKYYLMGVEKGNSSCMNNLGHYYRTIENDYDNAKKYYLMGIEKGNSDCMYNLGNYYETKENDHYNAKKYYLMSLTTHCSSKAKNRAFNLGEQYWRKKDYDTAVIYYSVGCDKGSYKCMYALGNHYKKIKKQNLSKKYFLMAIKKKYSKGNDCMVQYLSQCDKNDIKDIEYIYTHNLFKRDDEQNIVDKINEIYTNHKYLVNNKIQNDMYLKEYQFFAIEMQKKERALKEKYRTYTHYTFDSNFFDIKFEF